MRVETRAPRHPLWLADVALAQVIARHWIVCRPTKIPTKVSLASLRVLRGASIIGLPGAAGGMRVARSGSSRYRRIVSPTNASRELMRSPSFSNAFSGCSRVQMIRHIRVPPVPPLWRLCSPTGISAAITNEPSRTVPGYTVARVHPRGGHPAVSQSSRRPEGILDKPNGQPAISLHLRSGLLVYVHNIPCLRIDILPTDRWASVAFL